MFSLPVTRLIPGLIVVGLDPCLFHPLIHAYPPLLQVGFEVGLPAGEFVTLKTEINTLFPETGNDTTTGPYTRAISAALTIPLGQVSQHLFEHGVLLELRKKG